MEYSEKIEVDGIKTEMIQYRDGRIMKLKCSCGWSTERIPPIESLRFHYEHCAQSRGEQTVLGG